MKRFLGRFFPKLLANRSGRDKARSTHAERHDAGHQMFRTPRGQGPFLLSTDGRVIPLRKSKFLRRD